ncbi:tetratricopeptide repeat protein [Holosporaceae bacterium 'Namur']|nr:tetratricopeptide repeat protein [Holosporaceae bacterium 'Namur']
MLSKNEQIILQEYLNEYGAEENLDNFTALHLAAIKGHDYIIEYLLNTDVDIHAQSSSGQSILHYAAHYGHINVILTVFKLLSTHDKQKLLNAQDKDGKTPLHYSALQTDIKTIEILLIEGIDINAKNNFGYTALHYSSSRNTDPKVSEFLISKGADIEVTNNNGDIPLFLAIKFKNDSVAMVLSAAETSKYVDKASSNTIKKLKLGNKELCQNSKEAINYFLEALNLFEEHNNLAGICYTLVRLGDIHLLQGDYALSTGFYNSARVFAEQNLSLKSIFSKRIFKDRQFSVEANFLRNIVGEIENVPNISLSIYKKKLNNLRAAAANLIKNESKEAKDILKLITQDIKNVFNELITECIKLIGKPPCEYSIIGLGSMSREEMVPFSDIEFGIIIEKSTQQVQDYFSNLSKLIEIKMISLGESNFPILKRRTQSLFRNGFCLDTGGNTPIGPKQEELIGTYEKMSLHQSAKKFLEDLILSNTLKTVCLINGSDILLKKYKQVIKKHLDVKDKSSNLRIVNKNLPMRVNQAIYLMSGDVKQYTPTLEDQNKTSFHVKEELYRLPSNLIANLSLYYGIEAENSWDRLNLLLEKKLITKEAHANLKKLLEFATKMRIKAHLYYNHEKEDIEHETYGSINPIAHNHEKLYKMDPLEARSLEESYRVLIPIHDALKVFVESKGKEDFKKKALYEDSLYIQARIAEKKCDYMVACGLYMKALKLTPDKMEIRQGLVRVQSRLGLIQNALETAIESLNLAKQSNSRKASPMIANWLNDIGELFFEIGDYNEALNYYLSALQMRIELEGEEHPEVAISLNNIGVLFDIVGKYQEAEDYHTKALQIRIQCFGFNHTEVAQSLNNIGVLKTYRNDEEAAKYLFQALSIRKKAYGMNHPEVATTLNNMGLLLSNFNNNEEALEYYLQALYIRENILGENSIELVAMLSNIACIYNEQKEYLHAEQTLVKALLIIEKNPDRSYRETNIILRNLATAVAAQSRFEDALNYSTLALKIAKGLYGDQHIKLRIYLEKIGSIYFMKKEYKKAEEYFQEALKVSTQHLGRSHNQNAYFFICIGKALEAQNSILLPTQYYQQASSILLIYHKDKDLADKHFLKLQEMFNNAVNIQTQLKNDEETEITYSKNNEEKIYTKNSEVKHINSEKQNNLKNVQQQEEVILPTPEELFNKSADIKAGNLNKVSDTSSVWQQAKKTYLLNLHQIKNNVTREVENDVNKEQENNDEMEDKSMQHTQLGWKNILNNPQRRKCLGASRGNVIKLETQLVKSNSDDEKEAEQKINIVDNEKKDGIKESKSAWLKASLTRKKESSTYI